MREVKDRVKIVATIGPASDQENIIKEMIQSGLDVFRLNLSHGSLDWHARNIKTIRSCAKELGVYVAIMADLQGPKIRITSFDEGSINIKSGELFRISFSNDQQSCASNIVIACDPSVFKGVGVGRVLLLDDGKISFEIVSVQDFGYEVKALNSGVLFDKKGVSLKNGGLKLSSLTEKDYKDINFLKDFELDYLALSFVKSSDDIHALRELVKNWPYRPNILAKIETAEAISNHREIIRVADGIMVARGDLAVEVGLNKVPWLQKKLLETAASYKKTTIVATQMMESMVSSSSPTRAEVSDVANAILDGADAVMLSAETAIGRSPLGVINNVKEICNEANVHERIFVNSECFDLQSKQQVIAWSAVEAAHKLGADWLVALTETGYTTLLFSKFGINLPILGLSRHNKALNQMSLYKNVTPVYFDVLGCEGDIQKAVLDTLISNGLLKKGHTIILTRGFSLGVLGTTNSMIILDV